MYQTDFTTAEFRERRARLCAALPPGAVALLPGAPGPLGSDTFDQYRDFYYLTGLETPRAYLLLDSRTARATAFLPPASQVEQQSTRPVACAQNADLVRQQTGLDRVLGWEDLGGFLSRASLLYLPFEDGENRTVSRHDVISRAAQQAADPWDTRLTRGAQLVATVRARFPQLETRNLTPLMEELRLIKSPAELAVLRRAGLLTAIGANEALRSTRPGVLEYQLDALLMYHYLAGGARDRGYHAIIAGGDNAFYGHYCANDCPLAEGDLVLLDCAPDYHYYTSDIGRMWPVNGTWSPTQRAIYGFVVEYHKVLLELIRPGQMVADLHAAAAARMRLVLADWPFVSPAHRQAAEAMFEFGGHISHAVGLTVHDGGLHYGRPLEPGMVISVDPQFRLPAERLYYRVEDTVVITADGLENLTAAAPLELDEVTAMMRQPGLLQAFPPS
ncbi:MAG: aminopeptidase P N-terminal domain-containing protein [Fimbriimonadaceae bacterium]|nr:aminopeptidase P N-terminal domain-containing protein [Fimbriimonadaceae bacterium]